MLGISCLGGGGGPLSALLIDSILGSLGNCGKFLKGLNGPNVVDSTGFLVFCLSSSSNSFLRCSSASLCRCSSSARACSSSSCCLSSSSCRCLASSSSARCLASFSAFILLSSAAFCSASLCLATAAAWRSSSRCLSSSNCLSASSCLCFSIILCSSFSFSILNFSF